MNTPQLKQSQSGFTLVELIVVIVLLGILGVTALGKFQDLSADAEQAALQGIASELTGASNINYSVSLLGNTPDLGIGDGASGGTENMNTTTAANACTETGLAALLTGGSTTLPAVGNVATVVDGQAYAVGITPLSLLTDNNVCAAAGDAFSCQITGGTGNAATALVTLYCTE